MKNQIYVFCILFIGMQVPVSGQDGPASGGRARSEELVSAADSMRREYRFQEALELYRAAEEEILDAPHDSTSATSARDSLLLEKIHSRRTMAENGLSMKQYVSEPVVVARHVFPKEDFYLFYPMQDRSWRPVPNPLDSIPGHKFVNATYFPEGSTDIYFSAEDQNGVRNLYHSSLEDSLWSVPALLDESLTSSGDEIFPVPSPDGKTIYFSSYGLYGVGGYDLYKTEWDPSTGTWGVPENLGFPYSSPYDDLLYFNTPDGRYTLFASNRGCPPDSVAVYVLEYDSMPVRRHIEDPGQIRRIAELAPVDDPSRMDTGTGAHDGIQENVDMSRYMAKMNEVRSLRDSISIYGQALEEKRLQLQQSTDRREQEELSDEIISRETRLPALQDSLAKASESLRQIEMEFLFNGVVIDPDKLVEQADREVVGAATNYVFSKRSLGDSLDILVKEPEVKFDYSFMVLPEGRFALDNTIPDGIVYQIQMFLLSKPASVAQIKGLSPVFEEKTATGKYIYRVGLFRTYNDVLSNLNTVKNLGFRTAFIVAFKDGEQYPVQKARALETKIGKTGHYQVRIVSPDESLPDLTIKAIRQTCDKDIAKVSEDGKTVFLVGPLDSEEQAEKLKAVVVISGIGDVSVVKLDN